MSIIDQYKYSVVIPVYNSKKVVGAVLRETVEFFQARKLDYEVILVNDNSRDGSWSVIRQFAEQNESVCAIDLLKNYGQHNAIFCGFHFVSGDYVITLDDDGQNPPGEMIHLMEQITKGGYDAVFGDFYQKQHSFIRRNGTRVINYMNREIFGKPQEITLTNFRIIKREVVERITSYRTRYPYIPGLVVMFSNSMGNVKVQHRKREVGKSGYGFLKIVKLVSVLLFNYSAFPVRMMSMLGVFVSMLSFTIGTLYLFRQLAIGSTLAGWTTLVVLISFLGGIVILMLGIIGEYIVRALNQLTDVKSYHIKEIVK